MKTSNCIFLVLVIPLIIISGCSQKDSTLSNPVKEQSEKVLSGKEIWFNSLDTNTRSLVRVIDSLPINYILEDIIVKAKAYDKRVFVTRTPEGMREETQTEDFSWVENYYNEESGELLKTIKFKGHIGNAYLLSVIKEDTWEQIYGEGGFFTKKYIFQYGVLLKPDTFGGKIYPAGTYVVTSYFLSEEEFNQNKKEFEYFSNYEKFLNFVIWEIGFSKEFIEFSPYTTSKPRKIEINL